MRKGFSLSVRMKWVWWVIGVGRMLRQTSISGTWRSRRSRPPGVAEGMSCWSSRSGAELISHFRPVSLRRCREDSLVVRLKVSSILTWRTRWANDHRSNLDLLVSVVVRHDGKDTVARSSQLWSNWVSAQAPNLCICSETWFAAATVVNWSSPHFQFDSFIY